MGKEDSNVGRLDGWKEISNYLRRDIRTCLRWEKELGLPVIRVNKNSKRSKVIAYRSEIDRWLAGERRLGPESAGIGKQKPRTARFVLISALVVLAGAALWLFVLRRPPSLSHWDMKGQTISIFDTRDRKLWSIEIESSVDQRRFYFEPPVLDSQGKISKKTDRPKVVLADVDRDGKKEVIYYLNHDDPAKRVIGLRDCRGRRLWEKTLDFSEIYLPGAPTYNFRMVQVGVDDVDGDGAAEILSLWQHDRDFPSVFQIHSTAGVKLFQYDHTGLLQFFVAAHGSAGLAAKDILLGGTNNLLGGDAVFVILDGAHLKSGLGPPYAIPDDLKAREEDLAIFVPAPGPRAGQKDYFRFKHEELSAVFISKWINVSEIHASPEALLIQVEYGPEACVYFRFDSKKRLISASLGADAERLYRSLIDRKMLTLPPEAYLKGLLRTVFAWDGEGWTPVPISLPMK